MKFPSIPKWLRIHSFLDYGYFLDLLYLQILTSWGRTVYWLEQIWTLSSGILQVSITDKEEIWNTRGPFDRGWSSGTHSSQMILFAGWLFHGPAGQCPEIKPFWKPGGASIILIYWPTNAQQPLLDSEHILGSIHIKYCSILSNALENSTNPLECC